MIGNTPETDIRGAKNFGMHSILLTRSGVMAERAVKDLLLTEFPTFFMESFCYEL